jgi:hypothetical protein
MRKKCKWMGNRRTKKNLSFNISFVEVIQIHVSKRLWGYKKKNSRNPKEI